MRDDVRRHGCNCVQAWDPGSSCAYRRTLVCGLDTASGGVERRHLPAHHWCSPRHRQETAGKQEGG